MHHLNIQVSDHAYAALATIAQSKGLSVEAMAASQLEAELVEAVEGELPPGFWTPGMLASLDAAAVEADENGGLTLGQIGEKRLERSRAWRENHPA